MKYVTLEAAQKALGYSSLDGVYQAAHRGQLETVKRERIMVSLESLGRLLEKRAAASKQDEHAE